MQELASRSGTVLLVGDERLVLLPFTAGKSELRSALDSFETVVCYKGGGRLDEVLEVARETGRLEDGTYGSWLGMNGGEIVSCRRCWGGRGRIFRR
jgi:precorrin-2/cobalt-factor-2 C20-methyltransferase